MSPHCSFSARCGPARPTLHGEPRPSITETIQELGWADPGNSWRVRTCMRSYGEARQATARGIAAVAATLRQSSCVRTGLAEETKLAAGERSVVRKIGFEPTRYCYRQPLKLVRLPVSPLPLGGNDLPRLRTRPTSLQARPAELTRAAPGRGRRSTPNRDHAGHKCRSRLRRS